MFSEKLRLTTSSRHEECTQRSRRLHYDHGKKLKQQLRQHGMYLFPSCHARHITTGVELPENLIPGLIYADIIEEKA